MKTNGGFLVTKIKQLGDRIFEKILSEKNIDDEIHTMLSPAIPAMFATATAPTLVRCAPVNSQFSMLTISSL